MTHTTDTAGQEWSDERMGRECAFAAAEYQKANNRFDLGGVKYSYEIVAKRMRDDMAATIATQAARIVELEKQVAWKEGLIRQLTEVDMPAMEADNERLRGELAAAQAAGEWRPVRFDKTVSDYEEVMAYYALQINRFNDLHEKPPMAICQHTTIGSQEDTQDGD